MKHKKILSLFFASVISTAFVLAACTPGEKGRDDSSDAGSNTNGSGTVTAAGTEKQYVDNLGEYDFKDADFVMLIWSDKKPQFIVDGPGEDVYSEAVYKRNRMIEDRFGVNLQVVEIGNNDPGQWGNHIAGVIASGLGDYDAVFPDYWMGIETGGYYLNLHDYDDIIDFSQPYWSEGWNNNAELWGQLYSAVGALSMEFVLQTHAVFYDRALLEGLGTTTDQFYKMVEDREWTLDKLLDYSRQAWTDSNADGTATPEEDAVIGTTIWTIPIRGLFYSSGIKMTTLSADGEWEYGFYNDKFLSVFEKLQSFCHDPSVVVNGAVGNMFNNGQILFSLSCLYDVNHGLADADNWALVPIPLFDENQEDYIAFNHGTYYQSILKTADDPTMSAVILEALNAESYRSVRYAFLEINFKNRFQRDEKMPEMIDLILSKVYYDFAFVNGSNLGYINDRLFDLAASSDSAATWWGANETYYKQTLKDFQDYFKALQNNPQSK